MSVPTFSWVHALEEGVLTDMQLRNVAGQPWTTATQTLFLKLPTCWITKRRTPPVKSRGRWRTKVES